MTVCSSRKEEQSIPIPAAQPVNVDFLIHHMAIPQDDFDSIAEDGIEDLLFKRAPS
jgi:hypothetical protein